jgi:P-type Cu2+ transporter
MNKAFTFSETLTRHTFPVLEMSCAACAVSVESMLKATKGVKQASVNYANQEAIIEYDEFITQPVKLQEAIRSIGYDLVIDLVDGQSVKEEIKQQHYEELKIRTWWAGLFTLPVVIIGMFFMNMPYANYLSFGLATPVIFYFGRSFFLHAWKQARFGKATMDTLVALSTGIAYSFSAFNTFIPDYWQSRGVHTHVYFEAAAVVITFILLGKVLEEKAKSNTTSALKKLMSLQPKTVRILRKDEEIEVSSSSIIHGDLIMIRPGERIPVDGVIISGSSYVDESMISGEPMAVEKTSGAHVFAGTINQKGSLKLEAVKVGSETLLAQIIKSVQQAQGSKAPVQKLVDKVAGIFVPIVLTIAIFTFCLWMLIGAENALAHALLTSVTVLVIACPCALGLATPTAIMVGIGKGAENNILIKDAESLEQAHRVNTIILDKTGTITEGRPVLTQSHWLLEDNLRAFHTDVLYAIELHSEHPLAQAIIQFYKKEKVTTLAVEAYESLPGKGVKARVQQALFYFGNERLMKEVNISIPSELTSKLSAWEEQAMTIVYFSSQDTLLAIFAIEDKVKASSQKAISALQAKGISVHMLTGDNIHTAKAVAAQVGIKHYKASMLPAEKAAYIEALQQKGNIIAMVGDGINDSHALAQANVSIAMGKGSDVAMDVAKITLITSDLMAISKALQLSTNTIKIIRQNLFWAFVYNLIGIPIAAGILYPINGFLMNPMFAGAAMALSSVSVVANSLRLKLIKL